MEMITYNWTILRLRSVPGDPAMLRDIFWKITATEGEHVAEMESSFSLAKPVLLAGITQSDLVRIVEAEISAVRVEQRFNPSTQKLESTQPDGFDGNALELYRHLLANELAAKAKPKPMELEVPA